MQRWHSHVVTDGPETQQHARRTDHHRGTAAVCAVQCCPHPAHAWNLTQQAYFTRHHAVAYVLDCAVPAQTTSPERGNRLHSGTNAVDGIVPEEALRGHRSD